MNNVRQFRRQIFEQLLGCFRWLCPGKHPRELGTEGQLEAVAVNPDLAELALHTDLVLGEGVLNVRARGHRSPSCSQLGPCTAFCSPAFSRMQR